MSMTTILPSICYNRNMVKNYYDEVIKEIEDLFAAGEDEEAEARLREELSMLYVPGEFGERLRAIADEHRDFEVAPLPLWQIEDFLFSDIADLQMRGVTELKRLNLRDHKDLIDAFLAGVGTYEGKISLIEEMIAQGLRDEFSIVKDGMEHKFIPLYCELPTQSDGYIAAMDYLDRTIMNEDPSLAKLCKDVVGRIAFLDLPLSLSEEEGLLFAKSSIAYVYHLFGLDAHRKAYEETIGEKLIDPRDIDVMLGGR